jgi:hypothetical protein
MAREAIYVERVGKVSLIVRIPIPDVATRAALLVALNTDAEIVEYVSLADVSDSLPGNVLRPLPLPMRRVHDFFRATVMARDAGSGDILGTLEFLFEFGKQRMID